MSHRVFFMCRVAMQVFILLIYILPVSTPISQFRPIDLTLFAVKQFTEPCFQDESHMGKEIQTTN